MKNLQQAARILDGELSGSKILCPGPGHSKKDRSLLVTFDASAPDGFALHSFAGDPWQECKDYVKNRLGIESDWQSQQPRARPVVRVDTARPETNHTPSALKIWNSASLIYGTPAEAYLISRGLALPDNINHAMRYHPNCPFKVKSVPTMVAAMVGIHTNEFRGIHRTRLSPKDKAMLGPAKGAVVKLSRDESVEGGLAICEGIETGLALMAMGFVPLWCCLSAGGVAKFPVLSGINSLTIFADNDQTNTGQNAAIECRERWQAAGKEAVAYTTPEIGTDFADWKQS